MKKIQQLTSKEIDAINQLMKREAEIVLQPRKKGYVIFESQKNIILRTENNITTE